MNAVLLLKIYAPVNFGQKKFQGKGAEQKNEISLTCLSTNFKWDVCVVFFLLLNPTTAGHWTSVTTPTDCIVSCIRNQTFLFLPFNFTWRTFRFDSLIYGAIMFYVFISGKKNRYGWAISPSQLDLILLFAFGRSWFSSSWTMAFIKQRLLALRWRPSCDPLLLEVNPQIYRKNSE